MKKKLFFQNSANVNTNDNSIETLLSNIPFYGIKGTICRIEVLKDDDDGRELCYYKVLYNHDGTVDSKKVRVPRSKGKNFTSLLNDYYEDLKNYLDLNHNKYLDCKANRLNKKFNKRYVEIGVVLSAILAVGVIPILISTVFIGAVIEATFLFSFYLMNELRKKIVEDEKKHQFIKEYDKYQKKLIDYHVICSDNEDRVKKTAYTEISLRNQSLDKDFPKIKILMKDENIEAA